MANQSTLNDLRRKFWMITKIMSVQSVCTRLSSSHANLLEQKKCLRKKRVELPQNWFGTPTWLLFHCFGTPIWRPRRHVHTLYTPSSIYQYSNEASRLTGQNCNFFKFLLSLNSQGDLDTKKIDSLKHRSLFWKPQNHMHVLLESTDISDNSTIYLGYFRFIKILSWLRGFFKFLIRIKIL